MHTNMERKCAAKAARVRHASRGSNLFIRAVIDLIIV